MTDDGRLELDEDGHLLEGDRAVETLDLADPEAGEAIPASRVAAWVDASITPWVRAHRRVVVATGVALAVGLVATAWWQSRPPYVAPQVTLELANAVAPGNDVVGPSIVGDRLTVAYTGRAVTPGDVVQVLRLSGPGLRPDGDGATVLTGERARGIVLGARLDCTDPTLTGAGPSSYGLDVRRTDAAGDVSEATALLGGRTGDLGIAVVDHCVGLIAPSGLRIVSTRLSAHAGSPVADLVLDVANDSPLALTVATQRRPDAAVEVDLSPTIAVAPGTSATIATRLFLHDCSGAARISTMADLPNAVPGAGVAVPGVTLQVGLGLETSLVSVPLPDGGLDAQLRREACSGGPAVSARLSSAEGVRSTDGGWRVSAVYDVRTTGMGVSVGREQFVGPPAGRGSSVVSPEQLVPGTVWAIAPTQLDGGAGRVTVSFSGPSCDGLPGTTPPVLDLSVVMPDHTVYPYAVTADDVRLAQAAYAACRVLPELPLAELGWRTYR